MKKLIEILGERFELVIAGLGIVLVAVWSKFLPGSILTNNTTSLVLLVAIMTTFSLGIFRRSINRRDELVAEKLVTELASVRKSLSEPKPTELAGAVEQKKDKFQNISNISFHFADKEKIINFYNDYFKEPTVEQMVAKLAGEVSGEVKGKIPQIIESKVGGKDLSEWVSTIKLPGVSTAEMFRRWQREAISKNEVAFGLELVDIDLSDLKAFDDLVSRLKTKFDMQLDNQQVSQQQARLKKRAAEKTIVRLETATGMVLVEGKFRITELSTEYYKCIYEHPVNEYFIEADKKITIGFSVRRDSVEPSIAGNYALSIGKSIPLVVFGRVWQPVDRKEDVWELQITPIVVY